MAVAEIQTEQIAVRRVVEVPAVAARALRVVLPWALAAFRAVQEQKAEVHANVNLRFRGAGCGIRTRTPFQAIAFEAIMSALPSTRLGDRSEAYRVSAHSCS